MKLFAPWYKPVAFALLVVYGLRRVLWPERVLRVKLAQAARKKAQQEKVEQTEPQPEPPITAADVRRVRLVGVVWVVIGAFGFWANQAHVGISNLKSASATGTNDFARVEARAREFMAQHSLVNMSVAVVANGKEAVFGLGPKSLLGLERVDGNTLFEIGSITKTFTGVLLAKLVTEKKVSLDQPVKKLLPPEASFPHEWADKITLRSLTTHSSGLPMMPPNFPGLTGILRILGGFDPHPTFTEEKLFAGMAKTKLDHPPGEKSDYSNYGTGILGYALARSLGGNYEEVILREICKPLGMNQTTITLNDEQKKKMARGYDTAARLGPITLGRAAPAWTLPNAFAGAGGLRSSANEMLLYLKANMGLTAIPLNEAIRKSHEPLFDASDRHRVGMNWLRRKAKSGEKEIIWHNGGTGGFRCFIGFTEDRKYGVVILCGTSKSVDPLGSEILNMLLKHTDLEETKLAVK